MLISKFDLYKPEWLELVFDNRNKEYGAYELRQHYSSTMARAMGFTFLGIALLFGAGVIFRTKAIPVVQVPVPEGLVVTLSHVDPPLPPVKRTRTEKPSTPVHTNPDLFLGSGTWIIKVTTPPPVITQLTGAIGQTDSKGKDIDPGVVIEDDKPGTGTPPAVDNSVHIADGLDVMPAPVGGDKAWAKFLGKNLRYPSLAQEEGASGMVLLTFIIEKDGSLSNIAVNRAAGHGFDEEALRVLKMAKAWKPGMQNGQPVRVRFSIPISFHLSEP